MYILYGVCVQEYIIKTGTNLGPTVCIWSEVTTFININSSLVYYLKNSEFPGPVAPAELNIINILTSEVASVIAWAWRFLLDASSPLYEYRGK